MLTLPVRPAASRTVAVSVCVPFGTVAVFQARLTGPRADVVWLPTCRPSALNVKTLAEPLVPSTHSTTHAAPLTVALACGWVMKTRSALGVVGGGGAGAATCR